MEENNLSSLFHQTSQSQGKNDPTLNVLLGASWGWAVGAATFSRPSSEAQTNKKRSVNESGIIPLKLKKKEHSGNAYLAVARAHDPVGEGRRPARPPADYRILPSIKDDLCSPFKSTSRYQVTPIIK